MWPPCPMTMSVLLREGFEVEVALERAGGVGGGEIGFQVNRQGRETVEVSGWSLRAVHEIALLNDHRILARIGRHRLDIGGVVDPRKRQGTP